MTFRFLTEADFPAMWEIMCEAFPQTEHRTEKGQRDLYSNPYYRVCGAEEEGRLLAFFAYWDFGSFCFGEHLASRAETRGKGIGGELFSHVAAQAKGRIWFEVEPPETEMAQRRIGFYCRHDCELTEFGYMQPSLQKGQPEIPLRIMSAFSFSEEEFLLMKNTVFNSVYS